jgi:hypothetical protein
MKLSTRRSTKALRNAPIFRGSNISGLLIPPAAVAATAFALAIGHRGPGQHGHAGCLAQRQPRFVPKAVVKEFSDPLKLYRVSKIKSDRFANAWASDEWGAQWHHCSRGAYWKLFGCSADAHVRSAVLLDNERPRPANGLETASL